VLLIFQPAEVIMWMKVTQIISEICFTAWHKLLLQKLFREMLHFRH
jgi:hypothetical protein